MTSWLNPDLFESRERRPWPFGDLAPQSYDVIMADPPWEWHAWSEYGLEKSPEAQYDTMDIEAIKALPVADLARENCLLWLWATQTMLDQQIEVLRVWGFTFKTAGAWNKRRWGPGYIWRSKAEFILIGTRGEPKANGKGVPNYIEESARQHSRKPDGAYSMVEEMLPDARRCSLFERPVRYGWEGWGHEYGKPIVPGRKKRVRDLRPPPPLFEFFNVEQV